MVMDNLKLSIFFNADRVYLMVCEPTPDGLKLIYVNSTENPIDLEFMDSPQNKLAINELNSIFSTFDFNVESISVSLSADTILVSHLPGKANITQQEIKQLISLEIRQAFPMFSFEDFVSSVVPTEPDLNSKSNLISIIIPKVIMDNCKNIMAALNAPIVKFEISQINAHQSFLYNYPEYAGLSIAFFQVQDQFIDVSLVNGEQIYYYNLISLNKKDKLGEICAKELLTFAKNYNQSIDLGVFFGSGLTKENLAETKVILKNVILEVDRLNAFRMIKTDLPDRVKEYCSRTSHIFPSCIGGFMPYVSNKLNLYI
jgi:hypothetical protein